MIQKQQLADQRTSRVGYVALGAAILLGMGVLAVAWKSGFATLGNLMPVSAKNARGLTVLVLGRTFHTETHLLSLGWLANMAWMGVKGLAHVWLWLLEAQGWILAFAALILGFSMAKRIVAHRRTTSPSFQSGR